MAHSSDARETRDSAAEVKFLIDPVLAGEIRRWARAHLGPDPNGSGEHHDQYCTSSVYFDTAERDVFYRRGSFGRSKYRIRRYDCSDLVFLERKLTKPGLVTKRRTRIPQDELACLVRPTLDRPWRGDWFLRRLQLRRLEPVCQVSYQRTARAASVARGQIRLTLDEGVRVVPLEALGFRSETGTPVVGSQVILELKYSVEMPDVFHGLVETFRLTPQTASKYRLGLVATGHVAKVAPI